MKKIRAEPGKHRLDNGFMKWSQETIEANKKTGHGMGHSDISMTMNVYNHGSIERMQNEMKKLEKYM